MNKIRDINLKSSPLLSTILGEYCDDLEVVPTQNCKDFFGKWETKVPAKLIRQCIFAVARYAGKRWNCWRRVNRWHKKPAKT